MPLLPSGLNLGISGRALFDHQGNWFKCPPNHIWYSVPDENFNAPPFEPGEVLICDFKSAPCPQTTEITDIGRFIHVLEIGETGKVRWRGEWLATFPKYQLLSPEDLEVWWAWVDSEETQNFLVQILQKCRRLAVDSANASGFARLVGPATTRL